MVQQNSIYLICTRRAQAQATGPAKQNSGYIGRKAHIKRCQLPAIMHHLFMQLTSMLVYKSCKTAPG